MPPEHTYHVKLDKQMAVLLVGAAALKGPSRLVELVVEVQQQLAFQLRLEGHVVLHRVEAAQHKVEDGDGRPLERKGRAS